MNGRLDVFDKINWDFDKAKTSYGAHSFHWYLSTFVPQIPNILISTLSDSPEDLIFDPFCGGGTTLVEAMRLNRKSIGTDLNPLAIFMTKVKTTLINPVELEKKINDLFKEIDTNAKKLNWRRIEKSLINDEPKYLEILKENVPNFPDKYRWFHKNTLLELSLIKKQIGEIENKDIREFCFLAFSDRLKYSSIHSSRNYGYIADNCLTPSSKEKENYDTIYKDAIKDFKKKITSMLREFKLLYGEFKEKNISIKEVNNLSSCFTVDSRNVPFVGDETVSLVVTSPPYPLATDYMKGSRLSFYWLRDELSNYFPEGLSITDDYKNLIKQLKLEEIGPRYKRHSKKAGIKSYFQDMDSVLGELNRVLKPGGYMSIIIGGSNHKIGDITIPEKIIDISKKYDFDLKKQIHRKITNHRFPAKRIENEDLLIFCK